MLHLVWCSQINHRSEQNSDYVPSYQKAPLVFYIEDSVYWLSVVNVKTSTVNSILVIFLCESKQVDIAVFVNVTGDSYLEQEG